MFLQHCISGRVLRLGALVAIATAAGQAQADASDALKSHTDLKQVFVVYDLPTPALTEEQVRTLAYKAVTYRGDNAVVQDLTVDGEAPEFPGHMKLKAVQLMTVTIHVPICPGAGFTVSSSDNSAASWGDSAQYMACGFRYAGGWRVDFFASSASRNGSLAKSLGKALVSAVGLKTDPMQLALESLDKFEEFAKAQELQPAIVQMIPSLPGKTAVQDPLVQRQKALAARDADRKKRLEARAELAKLGIDATDRARLIKAVQGGDQDVVELFVVAGAIDLNGQLEDGKKLRDYASTDEIRTLLTPKGAAPTADPTVTSIAPGVGG